jgi:hypothetical protein
MLTPSLPVRCDACGVHLICAVAFFAKPFAEKNIKPIIPNKSAASITASAVGGMACITFVYPLDIVRGRVTTTPGVYKGMVDGLMQIGRAEGLAGLYKGCSHANIWAIPYYIAMFQVRDSALSLHTRSCNYTAGSELDPKHSPPAHLTLIPDTAVSVCLCCCCCCCCRRMRS